MRRFLGTPFVILCLLFPVEITTAAQAEKGPEKPATAVGQPSDFYPVAVWYGGGKARAPMLERLDATSAQRWGKDLDQIKSVGFTTVKC